MRVLWKPVRTLMFLTALALLSVAVVPLAGCDQKKEKIVDIEAPGVDVEVEKSEDNGSVGVDVNASRERN